MAVRIALLCGLLFAAGCSSTRQIRTSPPRPAIAPEGEAPNAQAGARLSVVIEPGTTALPEGVAALRFRLKEIHLREADGGWTAFPAEPDVVQIPAPPRPARPLLSTRLPPVPYDSLALVFDEVFVQYDANSGGPLTLPGHAPLRLPLTLHLAEGRPVMLRLRFEPGASLSHDDACRWFFLPFFDLAIE